MNLTLNSKIANLFKSNKINRYLKIELKIWNLFFKQGFVTVDEEEEGNKATRMFYLFFHFFF